MHYCPNCGREVDPNAYVCLNCGFKLKDNGYDDSGNIGWGILGYFVPLAGLVLFIALKDTKPRTAKMAGKGALISVIVHTILSILFFILFASLIVNLD